MDYSPGTSSLCPSSILLHSPSILPPPSPSVPLLSLKDIRFHPVSSQKPQLSPRFFHISFIFPLHFLWQIKRFLTLLCYIVLKIRVFRLVFPFSALKPLIRYFQEPHPVPSMSPFCILHISVLQQTWKTCISGSPYSLYHHRGSNNGHTYNRIMPFPHKPSGSVIRKRNTATLRFL